MLLTEIVEYYNSKEQSIKQIARKFGISEAKVLKCLVTANIYPTDTARAIKKMRDKAMTESEIAKSLGVSVKSLDKYTPYTKTIYNDNPSENAKRIRRSRNKKQNEDDEK